MWSFKVILSDLSQVKSDIKGLQIASKCDGMMQIIGKDLLVNHQEWLMIFCLRRCDIKNSRCVKSLIAVKWYIAE